MSLTLSNMMELDTKAPNFSLIDTLSNTPFTLSNQIAKKATVIVFICNHCPFVHHINSKLVEVANKYQTKGVQFIAISSNDIEHYPQDAPKLMKEVAEKERYPFPYLYDETQEVAKAYKAECTPDFFIFDKDLNCAYRGRFDQSRPNMGIATGNDLSLALDAIISGEKPLKDQYPSMGCNIKWKK